MNNTDFERATNSLHDDFTNYKAEVKRVLEKYRNGVSHAKERYNSDTFSAEKQKLMTIAHNEIETADKVFHDLAIRSLQNIRNEFEKRLSPAQNRNLMQQMQDYKTFGLKMNRDEVKAFIRAADGNYTALRAVASVAKDSGFAVSIPDMGSFYKEIERIERETRTPVMYAPGEYMTEAIDVLSDVPKFRGDGSVVYTNGRPQSIYLITRRSIFESSMNGIDAMCKSFDSSFVPEITEIRKTDYSTEDEYNQAKAQAIFERENALIENAENTAIQNVDESIMAQNIESSARSKETLAHYINQ